MAPSYWESGTRGGVRGLRTLPEGRRPPPPLTRPKRPSGENSTYTLSGVTASGLAGDEPSAPVLAGGSTAASASPPPFPMPRSRACAAARATRAQYSRAEPFRAPAAPTHAQGLAPRESPAHHGPHARGWDTRLRPGHAETVCAGQARVGDRLDGRTAHNTWTGARCVGLRLVVQFRVVLLLGGGAQRAGSSSACAWPRPCALVGFVLLCC